MLSHDSVFLTLSEGVTLFLSVLAVSLSSIFSSFDDVAAESLFWFRRCAVRLADGALFVSLMLNRMFLNSANSSRKVLLSFVMYCRIAKISSLNFDKELITELTSSSNLACSALNNYLSWSILSILRFRLERPEIAPSG
jgi:hypothetical protein